MEKFIADPVASALDTPSGKIEIFSEKLLKDTVGQGSCEGRYRFRPGYAGSCSCIYS